MDLTWDGPFRKTFDWCVGSNVVPVTIAISKPFFEGIRAAGSFLSFSIDIDELLEASALEAKHKSLLPRKARGSASPSKEGHGSPTRAPFADSHPHRSGSEHQGGGRQFTRRRKRKAAYGCVVSFDETHMTAEDLDIVDLQPPDHQPTLQVFDSTPSAYVESLKQALSSVSAGAAKANGKITSKALLKQMLPLLQHSRVATAGNHLFSVERGLLDEMVGAELAKLPGLLEGQRPRMQRAPDNLDQIATTKRRKIPRNAAETDKSGAEPKLKLKLSLSTARLSPPPAAAVPAGFPVSTFQLHPKSPASGHPPEDIVNCICDQPQVDHGEFMIACDKCGVWYHGPCVGVPTEADQSSENWYCVRCQPRR
ncbi:uncharacterized protein EV422DRAFT_521544 [Fimicolochytrium jonesii]|uniref:uncharacterized protein n=1 Tax=Fimicolochytrium jonesii TaxID=1396493 RepID=UPI0022FE2491|nr:uncharacterized protein EV422DRAFT_521544 [Fimicolochytrium jonesii]KAI8823575.1 hypothetical protein EV422DRAFT_521544 [Fimicolochytrium jonesii]